MKIWIFGDSLCLPYNLGTKATGWPEIIAQDLCGELKNFAVPAADNFYIYQCYLSNQASIQSEDVVIVGWSHPSRKSFVYDPGNPNHEQCLARSFMWNIKELKIIRSRNPVNDTADKWSDFRPQHTSNHFYDVWFRDYYSLVEQKTALCAYFHAVKSTCIGTHVPFFFSHDSVHDLNLQGAGYTLDFILENECFINDQDAHFNLHGHALWAQHLLDYLRLQKKNSVFPVIELFDRLAIAEIKWQRSQKNKPELDWYRDQVAGLDFGLIQDLYTKLASIHNAIWNKESELKSGRDHELSLEEIGRRALDIRNLNNQRIQLKNAMAERLGCSVREIKKDHLSQ
jgi:hypothetical protein